MKRTNKLLSSLLVFLLLATPIISSCGNMSNMPTDLGTDENGNPIENFGDPYSLIFTSNNNGTCSVSVETNPIYPEEYTISIPEKSPNGDTVTEISSSEFNAFSNVPRVIDMGIFEEQILTVMAKNVRGDTHAEFLYKKLMAYYTLQNSSWVGNESLKAEMHKAFPVTQVTAVYVLDSSTSFEECYIISKLIDKYTNFSAEDNYNTTKDLIKLAEDSNIENHGIKLLNYSDKISKIELPNTVTSIAANAFANCISLKELSIPASVTNIPDYSICYNCINLAKISVDKGNSSYSSINNCLIDIDTSTLILSCRESVLTEDMNIKHIGEYAFCCGYSLETLIIPESVISIGNSAFIFPITDPADELFWGGKIVVPATVKKLGFAFEEELYYNFSIYYLGTIEEYNSIEKTSPQSSCQYSPYYYSKNEPIERAEIYWRFVDGVPTTWVDTEETYAYN